MDGRERASSACTLTRQARDVEEGKDGGINRHHSPNAFEKGDILLSHRKRVRLQTVWPGKKNFNEEKTPKAKTKRAKNSAQLTKGRGKPHGRRGLQILENAKLKTRAGTVPVPGRLTTSRGA